MNRHLNTKVIAGLLFCGLMVMPSIASAGGNSSWGWAKPLNKRMGAFYTSNKNANFSRNRTKRQTVNQYHVKRYTPYVPVQPVNPPTVIHQRHVPVAPTWHQAKPVVPAVKSQVITAPAPQVKQAAPTTTLPFRSQTNQFWQ